MGSNRAPVVFIVEDDADIRESYGMLLKAQPAGYRVSDFASAESFLADFDPSTDEIRCLLLDIGLPGMDGVALQLEMQRRRVSIPTLVLTGLSDIPRAVRLIQAGALDVLQKPVAAERLLIAVERALEHDRNERQRLADRSIVLEKLKTLSQRERDVAEDLLNGNVSKEVAAKLGIGTQTVLKHRSRILKKLQVRNEVELTHLLNRHGLTLSSPLTAVADSSTRTIQDPPP